MEQMTCNDVRSHWDLYYDSEGDAELHFQVSGHLARCPRCAQWFFQQGCLEDLIETRIAGAQRPSPELWLGVLRGAGLRPQRRSARWVVFAGLACAASLLAALWLGGVFGTPGGAEGDGSAVEGNWGDLTFAQHQRLAAGGPVEFESASDLDVEAYLRKRVSFPVRCPPRQDAGFVVSGAGVCPLGKQPAAYLRGRVGDTAVSIFILPREGLTGFVDAQQVLTARGPAPRRVGEVTTVAGVIDRNVVFVVGQASEDRLLRVLRAYGTYPEQGDRG